MAKEPAIPFELLVEHLRDAVLCVDEDERIRFANRAAEAMLGWEHGTLAGHTLDELVPAPMLSRHRDLVRCFREAKQPVFGRPMSGQVMRADGSELPVEALLSLPFGTHPPWLVLQMRDRTSSRETERRTQILSEVTRALLEHVGPDEAAPLRRIVSLVAEAFGDWCSFSLIDDEGLLTQVASWHPDPRQRSLGERWTQQQASVHWKDSPLADALRTGEPVVREALGRTDLRQGAYDAESMDVFDEIGVTAAIVVPMRSGGKPIGYFALTSTCSTGRRWARGDVDFATDLADRAAVAVDKARLVRRLAQQRRHLARARDEARRHAAELLAVLDAVPNGILIFDADARLTYVSPRAEELFAAPLHEAIGATAEEVEQRFGEQLGMRLRTGIEDHEHSILQDSTARLSDEVVLERSHRHLARSTVPVLAPDGAFLGRLFVYTDITRARALERMRGDFLTAASHELKTPLTPLSIELQRIRRNAEQGLPVEERNIERALRQLDRIGRLVDDLLDASGIEAGRLAAERKPLDLALLARRVLDDLAPVLSEHRLRFEAPREAVWIIGDAVRLEQVLANLVQNAVKYSATGTQVLVRVEARASEACISVTDQGIGIPLEEQPRLFERFFRAANATVRHYGGLGVGLYVSRNIVEQHGGRFEVQSTPDQGSTFRFCLPRAIGKDESG